MNKRWITIAVIVCIITAGVASYAIYSKKSNTVAVKVFNAKKENILSTVSATGIVDDKGRYNVYIDTTARVLKLNVKSGDTVKKGNILGVVDISGIKIQLEQAKVSYTIEKINLDNLKKNLGIPDTTQAEATVSTSQLALKQKEQEYLDAQKRCTEVQQLYDTGATSKSDLNKAQQVLKATKIELENAQLNYTTAQKELETAKEESSRSAGSRQAQIDMQANKVALAELKINELTQSLNDVNLSNGNIVCPIDGSIASIDIKEGDITKPREVAFSIVNLEQFIINAKINETDIKDVKLGNKVIVSGNSIDPEKYEGVVNSISPVAKKEIVDKTEQTVVDVEVLVKSSQTLLKPGFNVDLKIETRKMDGVLAVPSEAVRDDKDGKKFVYVVMDGKAKKVEIEPLIKSDMYIGVKEVKGSMDESSKVVYSSTASLKEDIPVSVTQVK